MQKGFEQKRDYEFQLHVQTLRVLRVVGFYSGSFKKGTKIKDIVALPLDDEDEKRVKIVITQDDIKKFRSKFSRSIPKSEIRTKEEVLNGKK